MKKKKIIIAGYNVIGFGGMETVFNSFYRLVSSSKDGYEILFVFFEDKFKNPDDQWLGNKNYIRIKSNIKNTKLRRLHFAYKFSKLILQYKPEHIISYDSLTCYISSWARRFSFRNTNIFSWCHSTLHNTYKAEYVILADKHLSISSGITTQFRNIGVSPDNIYTIYNPVTPKYEVINRSEDNEISFLYLGRITFDGQKNLKELFQALSNVHGNWILNIVGSGCEEEITKLKKLAFDLGIDSQIKWHGWQKQPWDYIITNIKNVTCLLLTSSYEGFGMVLCEAISYGIYVISSNCQTGPSDIVRNGINGELYPLNDIDILSNKIKEIVNGKQLPNYSNIKESITEYYDDIYHNRIIAILSKNSTS
ncbi:glycosyltransferase [Xenorhabdus nematophila]|uniref:glycosyltransferase n=1 Tax=Xenorhabdus nematophila TaxID=628 RepID=UPI000543B4F0|nr:glycosyltransferase [Xenorhabdus nematophila]CEF31118.1 RFAB [Xenorhabdus nematophila str. Websteri]AYA40780.1 glycosyl transferase [Xenorhabdus nematophila]MBA0019525.1 glycosyltransferase [Xenorhabdus nematophila]MCB4426712.1 glycosyltransferase [Xenorhabdus nematophila]QNJ35204.1 glycosyltransferase [Xenorhabdus nematophila]